MTRNVSIEGAAHASVLVVDDDPSVRQMVADVLEEAGHSVASTGQPERALELAADSRFEVAVVDLAMPGLTGLELVERLQELSPDTQVVILTGHGDVDAAVHALQFGVFDFLRKDRFDLTQLEGAVASGVARCRLVRDKRDLVRRLEKNLRLLEALNDVAAERSGARSLDAFLARLANTARSLCLADCARALIFGRGHTPDVFVVEAAAGEGAEELRGLRLHAGEGLAARAASDQETFRLDRAAGHEAYSQRCDALPTQRPGFMCVPLRHGSVRGALAVAGAPAGSFSAEDCEAITRLAGQAAVGVDNVVSNERAGNFFTHTADLLVSILDALEPPMRGHSRATAALADMLARRLGLPEEERRTIHFAGLLHDIGKLRLGPGLFSAGGVWSRQEQAAMKTHPQAGVDMLRPITAWHDVLPIVVAHHERWDGGGYPNGLAGETIPLGARVVAVAEAFDAMRRPRSRGRALSPEEALAELTASAGSQFDPRLVRLFVAEYREHAEQIEVQTAVGGDAASGA